MAIYSDANERGYSRGGLDVVTAVNLFFKGILLFPVFLLAGYIGVIMMKHMIFQGIPSMTTPTQEQREEIWNRDQGKVSTVPERTYDSKLPKSTSGYRIVHGQPTVVNAIEPSPFVNEMERGTRDSNARGGFDPRYDRR